MSFEDQVKARACKLKEEKKAKEEQEEEQQRVSKAAFRSRCNLAWIQAVGDEWPPVDWSVYTYGSGLVGGYGQFEYEDHTWYVYPDFKKNTWTWHESTVYSPHKRQESSKERLRDDLLTALANPPEKKSNGFLHFG